MNSKGKVSFKNFQYFEETILDKIENDNQEYTDISKKNTIQEESFENLKNTERSINTQNEISINYLEGTDEFNDKNEILEMRINNFNLEDIHNKIVKFPNNKRTLEKTIKSINYDNNNSSSNIIDVDYNLLKKQKTNKKISNTVSNKQDINESVLKNERILNIIKNNTNTFKKDIKKDEYLNYFEDNSSENVSIDLLKKDDSINKRQLNLIDIKNVGNMQNLQNAQNFQNVHNAQIESGINGLSKNDNSDDSNISSLSSLSNSIMSKKDEVISYTNYLYTLDNFERKVFPKELEIFSKLNKCETQILNLKISDKDNLDMDKKEDLKIRKIKLLQNSLFIYKNMDSEQLLALIEINDNTFLDLGPKYKMTNDQNECIYYWNFTIWKDSKSYSFYSNSIDIMKACVDMINKVISQNDIFQLYRISKTPIYVNKKKLLNIYRAKRKTDGKNVILKVINKNEGNTNHSLIINTYLKEYKILNSLKHPYIIHNYMIVDKLESIKIVQEYCYGGTLYDYLYCKNFNITEKEACYIVFQLCSIVSYIHSYGIIHNDINLNSIFLEKNCEFSEIRLGSFQKIKFFNMNDENSGFCLEYNGPIVSFRLIRNIHHLKYY